MEYLRDNAALLNNDIRNLYNFKINSSEKILDQVPSYPCFKIDLFRIENYGKNRLLRLIYRIWNPSGERRQCQAFLLSEKTIIKALYNSVPPASSNSSNIVFVYLKPFHNIEELSICITKESSLQEGEKAVLEGNCVIYLFND